MKRILKKLLVTPLQSDSVAMVKLRALANSGAVTVINFH